MSFKVGQRIWIACDVKAGMFPNERSIRFELSAPERKVVSGFVPERFGHHAVVMAQFSVGWTHVIWRQRLEEKGPTSGALLDKNQRSVTIRAPYLGRPAHPRLHRTRVAS